MRTLLGCATAALGLACASCGNSNSLYPVSGTVTAGGRPAAGATVFLVRHGGNLMNEHTIMGVVQEDGSFSLVCGSLGPGAPPGEYDVLVEWRQAVKRGRGLARPGGDRFSGSYADPQHPLLHAVVKRETNHLPPFELPD
jgi:hypothetical protein